MKYVLIGALFLAACTSMEPEAEPEASQQRPIIDGIPTSKGMFPPVGALIADGHAFCTGTLISHTVVLTAAHCLDPIFIGEIVPDFTLALDARSVAPVDSHRGASKHYPPEWSAGLRKAELGMFYDIGILKLADPVEEIEPYPLATPEEAAAVLIAGTQATLVGYGRTQLGVFEGGIKHHASVELVEVSTHELLLARPGGQQACHGDSGGPTLLDVGDGLAQVGVASRLTAESNDCDMGAIYTRVDPYLPWIAEVAPEVFGGGTDAGPDERPDAGPPDAGRPDAAPGVDAGGVDASTAEGEGDSGGCGCAVAPARQRSGAGVALLWTALGGLLGACVRRQRRTTARRGT